MSDSNRTIPYSLRSFYAPSSSEMADGEEAHASSTMSPLSPLQAGHSDMSALIQLMLSQQQEDRRRREEERREEQQRREDERRRYEDARRLEETRRDEERRKHEADMMKLRVEMVQLQTKSDEEKAGEAARAREAEEKPQKDLTDAMEKARLAEEAEKAKTKAESAKHHLKRDLQKLTPKDRPSTFMYCFERLARENGVAKECWASCFVTCLSGDYLSMWASYVDSHEDADYDAIKAYFLNRVGLNWDSRSGLISCPKKPYNLTWDQYFYQCVEDLKLLMCL